MVLIIVILVATAIWWSNLSVATAENYHSPQQQQQQQRRRLRHLKTTGPKQLPPLARRSDTTVCWVGNHTGLRQTPDSTEPLLDPPVAVPDPYGWLRRDDSSQTPSAAILEHLHAENNYTVLRTSHLQDLRETLFQQMRSRILETDHTTPLQIQKDWLYYRRTFANLSYSVRCRAPLPTDLLVEGELPFDEIPWDGSASSPVLPGEIVYLDGNLLAEGQAYSNIGKVKISPSEQYVAYTYDNVGNEQYRLYIKDIVNDEVVKDFGPDLLIADDIYWGADDSTLYYLKLDMTLRPYQLYERRLALADDSDVDHETLLFEDQDYWVWAYRSHDIKYLFIGAWSAETTEMFFLPLDNGDKKPEVQSIAERRFGVQYEVEHKDGYWLVITNANEDATAVNAESTPNYRLVVSPAVANSSSMWVTLLDADGTTPLFDGGPGDKALDDITPFRNHLAVKGKEGGNPRIWIISLDTDSPDNPLSVTKTTQLTFEEDAYDAWISSTPLYDTNRVRVGYESLVSPRLLVSIDMNNIAMNTDNTSRIVISRERVPGYDQSLYKSRRTSVTSRDGVTEIPVSMVWRSDLVGLLEAPTNVHTLLYGYGSYGSVVDTDFSTTLLPVLDNGIVYVVAHVRGGGELGRPWYEAAKYLTKKRTFDDFVDVAKWLVGQDGKGSGQITSPEKLAINGGVRKAAADRFQALLASIAVLAHVSSPSTLFCRVAKVCGRTTHWCSDQSSTGAFPGRYLGSPFCGRCVHNGGCVYPTDDVRMGRVGQSQRSQIL